MPDQSMPVYNELVALSLAAEHWMIVEHQAGFPLAGIAMKNERRRKSADSPADDDTVIYFASFHKVVRNVLKLSVSDSMTSLNNRLSVAVRIRVVADAAVAGPIV